MASCLFTIRTANHNRGEGRARGGLREDLVIEGMVMSGRRGGFEIGNAGGKWIGQRTREWGCRCELRVRVCTRHDSDRRSTNHIYRRTPTTSKENKRSDPSHPIPHHIKSVHTKMLSIRPRAYILIFFRS